MGRSTSMAAVMVIALTVIHATPAAAQCGGTAVTLNDGDGFIWDITGTGGISNGTGDAYDCGLEMSVDGVRFPPTTTTSMELSGRQIVVGPEPVGSLSVTRRIYVPDTQGWARVLEYLENPGATSVTASVLLESNLGADSGTRVTSSSSGDTTFTTADRWVCTDDRTDMGGDPSTGHNYWGAGALAPSAVGMTVFSSAGTEGTSATFDVTVPAGATAILMYFATQSDSNAAAMSKAIALDALPAPALSGMSAGDLALVVNWPTSGAMDQPNGAPCVAATQCISGFCASGRCCNRACDRMCEVCSIAAGALMDGSCVVPASGCGEDAGPTERDAGPTVVDAGPRADAGSRLDGGSSGVDSGRPFMPDRPRFRSNRGGCCAVAGARTELPWVPALAFVALVLARLSRRRSRRD